MSLYDDFDKHRNSEKVAGWSSGIKLLQSQLQLKKAVTSVKKETGRKAVTVLAPVIDLKSKSRDLEKEDDSYNKYYTNSTAPFGLASEFDWNVTNEYDPAWPNEYEKVTKELRELRDREHHEQDTERKRRRDNPPSREFEREDLRDNQMANIAMSVNDRDDDRERTNYNRPNASGATIAPPPSLQDSLEVQAPPQPLPPPPPPKQTLNQGYATSTVAEKIMARYGFKAGQGLGKKEQGMSAALQVEKTSKRGGRIIHEKDLPVPLPVYAMSPPSNSQVQPNSPVQDPNEPSITEIMKDPSKVVLLRNMVGPGEVDDEIEPEVKEECNKKYGDVTRVMIHEVIDANPEEAVRIFVEFKRIESAIKAVVDLNGRFFGGRQVKAGFYSLEKLNAYQLLD